MEPIIEVKNIGKRYKIAHEKGGYISLRDVLMNIVRRPFSYLKHKAKIVAGLEKKEDFWALRGVNFTVNKGEVIGIIGPNGAGKSTLLKILSQITPPTEGEVIMRGTLGSLLEVGTGFHPELTGRENIFLNGAILGMPRKEIVNKFNNIVEFAGIDKFLDTPVKYYSSGMYVRLAFSVAAHMEPDILLVDEVLAVGDAEFQKKCLGKMEEVTNQEGRTIIFVSHNMEAIRRLCKKSILLKHGTVEMFGDTNDIINHYLETNVSESETVFVEDTNRDAQIRKVVVSGEKTSARIPIHKAITIDIEFEVRKEIPSATICTIFSSNGIELIHSYESDSTRKLTDLKPGKYKTSVTVPPFTFNVGNYELEIMIDKPGLEVIDRKKNICFKVVDGDNPKTAIFTDNNLGYMGTIPVYKTEKII